MSEAAEAVQTTETPAPAPEAGVSIPGEQQPQSDGGDYETRARAQGWVPKEEFRGPPDKWRDAEAFVKKGEEDLPVLRERTRNFERKFAEMEAKLARQDSEHKQNLANLERMSLSALQRQRDQLWSSYEAAMREAAAGGDVQRYDQLRRDQGQAVRQFDDQVREVRPQQRQPQPQAPANEVQEFAHRNAWFGADEPLSLEAQAIHLALQRERPELSLRDNLAETEKRIKERYPQRFGIQQKPQPTYTQAVVDGGGGRLPASTSRGKGATDLPADARKQGEKFVAQKLFKDLNEYAKEYFAQD